MSALSLVSVSLMSPFVSLMSPFRDWKPATPTLIKAITRAVMMATATAGSNH